MDTDTKIQYLRNELELLMGAFYRVKNENNVSDILLKLRRIVEVCESTEICGDCCKGLYFCTKHKGHKGNHVDDWGLSWD